MGQTGLRAMRGILGGLLLVGACSGCGGGGGGNWYLGGDLGGNPDYRGDDGIPGDGRQADGLDNMDPVDCGCDLPDLTPLDVFPDDSVGEMADGSGDFLADQMAPDVVVPDQDSITDTGPFVDVPDAVLEDSADLVEPQEIVVPDATPAVTWDNSVYTPAGQPFPIVGFGAQTKGGWQEGYDVYHVTTLADSGPGSLREGLYSNNAPRVVVFDLDGTIPLAGPLLVPSNITIDGRGRKVVLQGKGFVVPGSDEVIFINLALEDVGPDSEDAFQIGSAAPDSSINVVLDHIRLTQHGDNGNAKNVDEGISIIFGTRNVTIAWCRFEKWEKVLLAGNGDAEAALDGQITLTWHHSYAFQTGRRHPQARYGKYHLFNNFWDDWYMYGSPVFKPYPESFGAQIQDHGRMLLEGMMFRRHDHGLYDGALFSTANEATRCESSGDLLEFGTWILPDSTANLKFGVGCAKQEAFVPPYEVEPETAGPSLRDKLLLMTGNTL